MRRALWLPLALVLVSGFAAADPCVSGLNSGQRPGPYSFVLSTGNYRGQPFCFICDTADKPAVILFARTPSEATGKLANQIDKALGDHKAADLRGWVTFLSEDQPKLDPELVRWSQKHSLKTLPVGVFEDSAGPPSYKLAKDADLTVLLFVKRKVVANFAYRAGELNDEAIAAIVKTLPKIVDKP